MPPDSREKGQKESPSTSPNEKGWALNDILITSATTTDPCLWWLSSSFFSSSKARENASKSSPTAAAAAAADIIIITAFICHVKSHSPFFLDLSTLGSAPPPRAIKKELKIIGGGGGNSVLTDTIEQWPLTVKTKIFFFFVLPVHGYHVRNFPGEERERERGGGKGGRRENRYRRLGCNAAQCAERSLSQ